MSETGPDLSLNEAKNELAKKEDLTPETNDNHLTPTGAQALGNAMHTDLKELHDAAEDDAAITAIFRQHLEELNFTVTESSISYEKAKGKLDITNSEDAIKDIEAALTKEGLLEPEGMLGSLEGFASVAGFNELMEENGVPEEHRDMIMEWVAGFLDMLEETLGLDIGSDLRDLSFTKANGDQALDIAGEAGISLDNIGGTPGLAAFRKDFFNLNKGDGADMDFKDFFENQLDPTASQNKGTALGAVLVKLGKLKGEQLKLTPSQILDLREVSAKAAVPAENGNAAQVAEHSWTQINEAADIAELEVVINGLLGEYEEAQEKFKQKHENEPGHTLIGLLGENAGMEDTVADILKARYDGVQAVEIAEAANTAQITLANSVQLQVAYGEASNPPANHSTSTAEITLTFDKDGETKTATCAEQNLPGVLATLGALDGTDSSPTISGLEPTKDGDLVAAVVHRLDALNRMKTDVDELRKLSKTKATNLDVLRPLLYSAYDAADSIVAFLQEQGPTYTHSMLLKDTLLAKATGVNLDMADVDITQFQKTNNGIVVDFNVNIAGQPSAIPFKLTIPRAGNYTLGEKQLNAQGVIEEITTKIKEKQPG